MENDDIILELHRTMRELTERAERRIREGQLGEAWIGIAYENEPSTKDSL
jgi:hypothetical protein